MRIFSNIFFSLACLALISCIKDKPTVQYNPSTVPLSAAKKVIVINEGNFGSFNSSITLFDPSTNGVVEDIYKNQNNTSPGDVLQSIRFFNKKNYLVVNNSSKIIVCDEQWKQQAQITGLTSPRYFLAVSNQKAYVSDLKANAVSVLDLNSNTKTGSIPLGGWTEQMQMIFDKVFVCNLKRKYIYVIHTSMDVLGDSIDVGYNAGSLVIDRNDKVWVLSAGDSLKNSKPRLSKINSHTNKVETSFEFEAGFSYGSLCLNRSKDTLYFLHNGVHRFAINDFTLSTEPFIKAQSKNFYGLGIHPDNFTIYVADALDYVQKSNIYIYSSTGVQVQTFKAEINANGFYFE